MSDQQLTDSERERAIHSLRESYARGDLTGDQLEEKVNALFSVETRSQLHELLLAEHRETPFLPVSTTATSTDLEMVERHLPEGEHAEWVGRPDPTKHFTPEDRFLIPFSIFFVAFAVFWVVGASVTSGAFGLFGIPFLAIGLYNLFGRFIYKANRKRRTVYAVTNRRLLEIIRGRHGETVNATYLRSIPNISTSAVADGRGSIDFALKSSQDAWIANTGLDRFGSRERGLVSFYDIEDPLGVADLVERLRVADGG